VAEELAWFKHYEAGFADAGHTAGEAR
jgi:hypothetical protein